MASVELVAAALLSGVASGRVYPLVRPQEGTLPAVVTSVVSVVPDQRLDQTTGQNLYRGRVQADCFATSYSGLKSLVDSVRAAVHLKSGLYGSKTVVASMLDNLGPDAVDLDTGTFFQAVDFTVDYFE